MDQPKQLKRNAKIGRPATLIDPRLAREGEQIGGGYFVFRRTGGTGRIRAPEWPFEHPTREAADAERARLSTLYPNDTFILVVDEAKTARRAGDRSTKVA